MLAMLAMLAMTIWPHGHMTTWPPNHMTRWALPLGSACCLFAHSCLYHMDRGVASRYWYALTSSAMLG